MDIKKYVTQEQYEELRKEYEIMVKDKESISFWDFCTKTFLFV
jgi:hypothetical protein